MRLVLALVLLIVGFTAPSPARGAEPERGPCTSEEESPSCDFAYGEVTFVADGDTIDVRLPGAGVRRVRLTGINAMELTHYSRDPAGRRGACHAVAATGRLERLLEEGGGRVRLAAQDPRSMAGQRLRRQVSTRIDGSWVDTGRALVSEGRALWLPNGVEYAWNRSYRELSEQAAERRRRLFDSDACGAAARRRLQPELKLRWDAPGNDGLNVNGEWAEIENSSSRALDLAGWWFRDSSARRFTFPAGSVVEPGGRVKVHVGRGNTDRDDFYWGLPGPAFENASGGSRSMGDGGYLFDPEGNLRAWVIYPDAGDFLAGWRPRTVTKALLLVALLLLAGLGLVRARS